MSFSITFQWEERVEESFVLDYKDRPRYQHAEFANHEYKIFERKVGEGFTVTCNEKGHSSVVKVKGSPFKTQDEAKSAVSEHAAKLIDAKFSALSKSRSYANRLEIMNQELNEDIDKLKSEVEDAKDTIYAKASTIRERITLFSETPINALNEFLREHSVEEIQS